MGEDQGSRWRLGSGGGASKQGRGGASSADAGGVGEGISCGGKGSEEEGAACEGGRSEGVSSAGAGGAGEGGEEGARSAGGEEEGDAEKTTTPGKGSACLPCVRSAYQYLRRNLVRSEFPSSYFCIFVQIDAHRCIIYNN